MTSSGCMSRNRLNRDRAPRRPKPYCQCKPGNPVPWKLLNVCQCGEDDDDKEWKWESPVNNTWALLSEDQKTITFHPFYSSGTASVKGDMPMLHNYHYYWEVKMLSDTYGTDIMVGMCSDKAVLLDSQFEFKSLLGQDSESYGLSYKGEVRHSASVTRDSAGFCRGTIVGVRLDMWAGTMEFFINRKSQGVAFYNLRRHQALFPMVCSTAAQSSMRLIYAASWRASLQQEAVKTLASSQRRVALPPGLWHLLKKQVWLDLADDDEEAGLRPSASGAASARAVTADVRVAKPRTCSWYPTVADDDLWALPDACDTDSTSSGATYTSNPLNVISVSREPSVRAQNFSNTGRSNSLQDPNMCEYNDDCISGGSDSPVAEQAGSNSSASRASNTCSRRESHLFALGVNNICEPSTEPVDSEASSAWFSSVPIVRYDPVTALPLACHLLRNT